MTLALLLGALAGFICVGGLFLGMRILTSVQENGALGKGQRRLRNFAGAVVLMGQFLLALFVLYFSTLTREHPVWVGVGLVLSIFGLNLANKLFEKDPK